MIYDVGRILRRPPTAGLLLATSVGFAGFALVLVFAWDNGTARSAVYTGTPQFKVWATLTVAIIASVPVVWHVGIDLLRRLVRQHPMGF